MMSTTNPSCFFTTDNAYNLELLAALYDLNPNFSAYAQSINELFYYYIQHCTDSTDDFLLTPTDVHNILEVVNTLQKLKNPLVE